MLASCDPPKLFDLDLFSGSGKFKNTETRVCPGPECIVRRLAEVEVEFGFEFEGTLPCVSNGELRLSILVARQPTRCDNIRQVLKLHRTYQIALVCR